MIGAGAVRRLELALAGLVATAALLMLVVTVDAVRFHVPALLSGEHAELDAHTLALALLLAVEGVVLWRVKGSLGRQVAALRRLAQLPARGCHIIAGHPVTVVGGTQPRAFCAGLLSPRVCVTEVALTRLAPDELRAVVEHEACHARRRDPLRLAVAQVAADGFGFLAPLRRLPASQAAVADLAADAAAVAALGSAQPLAAAMVRLREPAPERVDHLLGRPLAVPHRLLFAFALTALGGLGGLAITLAILPRDPALPLALLPALAVPALLAFRASAGERPPVA
jgi:Zn-dependent protease with chaperone function